MNDNLTKEMLGNGFFVSEMSTFNKELRATGMSAEDLFNKLLDLRRQANIGDVIMDFYNVITPKMNSLEQILQNDEYYRMSDKQLLDKVSKDISAINQKFEVFRGYLIAERNMIEQNQNLLDAKKELHNLDKNTTLTDEERTAEAIRLNNRIKACQNAYNEKRSFFYEQKALCNDTIKGLNVIDFKNDILKSFTTLENDCKGLTIKPETKEKVSEAIREMRFDTASFALDNIKAKNEFDYLCKRYGLGYDGVARSVPQSELENELANTENSELDEEKEEEKEIPTEKQEKEEEKEKSGDSGDQDSVKENEPSSAITVDPDKQIAIREPKEIDIPKNAKEGPSEEDPAKEEPKIKVVAKRACKWLNEHKKQILIAVGIALLIVAVIVALQYLIPAITTMLQTSQVASLSSAMVNNGALWHGAIASEQAALHGANTALASAIQTMTGAEAVFDTASGIWTLGGTELGQFASAAMANASTAANSLSAISKGALGLGIGGIGLTGLGAILPKKSAAYKSVIKKIKALKKNMKNMSHEEVQQMVSEIVAEINANANLTDNEKNKLTNKSQRVVTSSEKLVNAEDLESARYSLIAEEIKEFNKNLSNMSEEEVRDKIYKLIQKIKDSDSLTNDEKMLLVKKTKKVYGKFKKLNSSQNLEDVQEEVKEEQEERGR